MIDSIFINNTIPTPPAWMLPAWDEAAKVAPIRLRIHRLWLALGQTRMHSAQYILTGINHDTLEPVTLPVSVGSYGSTPERRIAWIASTLARAGVTRPIIDLMTDQPDPLPLVLLHYDPPILCHPTRVNWTLCPCPDQT